MVDNNATDTTEDGQRKQVHSENGIRSPSLMGSNKDQGEVGTGNSPKRVSEIWKKGRSATKHKKVKKSYKNKHSKIKRRYRSTSSSPSTEKPSPSPKRQKSRRKKHKHRKRPSSSSYSSSSSSSSESS